MSVHSWSGGTKVMSMHALVRSVVQTKARVHIHSLRRCTRQWFRSRSVHAPVTYRNRRFQDIAWLEASWCRHKSHLLCM